MVIVLPRLLIGFVFSGLLQAKEVCIAQALNCNASRAVPELLKIWDLPLFQIGAQKPGGVQFRFREIIPCHYARYLPVSFPPSPNGERYSRQYEVTCVTGDVRSPRLVDVAEVHAVPAVFGKASEKATRLLGLGALS